MENWSKRNLAEQRVTRNEFPAFKGNVFWQVPGTKTACKCSKTIARKQFEQWKIQTWEFEKMRGFSGVKRKRRTVVATSADLSVLEQLDGGAIQIQAWKHGEKLF